MKKMISVIAIIVGSIIGAFLVSLIFPQIKERIFSIALGVSVGIILSRYLRNKKTSAS